MMALSDIAPGDRAAYRRADPFPYGWIDDYLPDALYRSLERSFISPDTHRQATTLARGKRRIVFAVPPWPDILGETDPVWRDWLETIGSRAFRAHCLDWLRQLVPLEMLPEGPYRELFRLRQAIGPDDTDLQCEFSNMAAGVFLPPHSDSIDKLLVFVHYYTPSGWQDEWGGGTDVYRPRSLQRRCNFSNFFLAQSEVERVESSAYRANRLFFFAKNHCAWHGVAPLATETALSRRSFNFSLRIRPDSPVRAGMADLEKRLRAAEEPAFGR